MQRLLAALLVVSLMGCSPKEADPSATNAPSPAAEPAVARPGAVSLARPTQERGPIPFDETATFDDLLHAYESVRATPVALRAPTDPAEFPHWQRRARERVPELLRARLDHFDPPQIEVVRTLSSDRDVEIREISYAVEPRLIVRAFLLTPSANVHPELAGGPTGARPGVVFWHGHDGLGARASVGLEPTQADNPHAAGALALARAGFVVLAPNIRSFAGSDGPARHLHFARIATLMGRTALGIFLEDAQLAVSLLSALPEVDPDRLGSAGFSLGGLIATLSIATDSRVDVAVSAAFLGSYRDTFAHLAYCPCEYPGGFGHEIDFPDVAALAAPRPLLFVMGDADPSMPKDAVGRAFQSVAAAYEAAGAPGAVELQWHPGTHEWVSAPAIERLRAALAVPGGPSSSGSR